MLARRTTLFTVGGQYRVIGEGQTWSWNGHGREMKLGEVLIFTGCAYSTYDETSAYIFRSEDGSEVWWALHDNEPVESRKDIFLKLGAADVYRR